eukprot:1159841-Pelagomonas_calceolata.AAC.4
MLERHSLRMFLSLMPKLIGERVQTVFDKLSSSVFTLVLKDFLRQAKIRCKMPCAAGHASCPHCDCTMNENLSGPVATAP